MKVSVSTSLEDEVVARVRRLAKEELTSDAAIIRRCVVRHLPELEREVLGAGFAAEPEPAKEAVNG